MIIIIIIIIKETFAVRLLLIKIRTQVHNNGMYAYVVFNFVLFLSLVTLSTTSWLDDIDKNLVPNYFYCLKCTKFGQLILEKLIKLLPLDVRF